jgi:biotin operon repressor
LANIVQAKLPVAARTTNAVTAERQRLVLCRLMIDIMRNLHGAYAPASEPFGSRLETFFIGLCVALGDFEDKPFSVSKVAAYMHVPRTTVLRRLDRLRSWGLIHRMGNRYRMDSKALNSLLGIRSYRTIRRLLDKANRDLTILDGLPD